MRNAAKHGRVVAAVAGEREAHDGGALVHAELLRAEADGPGRLVVDVEGRVQVHARLRRARAGERDLAGDEAHAIGRERDALADVPRHVADPGVRVVAELRLGDDLADPLDERGRGVHGARGARLRRRPRGG